MGRPRGTLCAQYLDAGNTNQEEFKKGNYSGDYSFRSPNGHKYGGCRPGLVPVKVPARIVVLEIVLGLV